MKKITAIPTIIGVVALTLFAVAPAAAARPAELSGSINLATDTSSAALSAESESTADSWPSYGDWVEFDTTVEGKLHKHGLLFVHVICMQDDSVVYRYSGDLDFSFPLVDQSGQNLDWENGGAASCDAKLMYRVQKGKSAEITILDTESFDVAAFTL